MHDVQIFVRAKIVERYNETSIIKGRDITGTRCIVSGDTKHKDIIVFVCRGVNIISALLNHIDVKCYYMALLHACDVIIDINIYLYKFLLQLVKSRSVILR